MPDASPDAFLPHRGSSLLLGGVVEADAERIVAVGRFPPDHAGVHDGRLETVLGIELAAQAAAAHEALRHEGGPQPLAGYLVGVRETVFTRPELPADTDLLVEIRADARVPPLYHFAFRMTVHGEEAMRGVLATYMTVRG